MEFLRGKSDIVSLLLEKGAEVNTTYNKECVYLIKDIIPDPGGMIKNLGNYVTIETIISHIVDLLPEQEKYRDILNMLKKKKQKEADNNETKSRLRFF